MIGEINEFCAAPHSKVTQHKFELYNGASPRGKGESELVATQYCQGNQLLSSNTQSSRVEAP